MKEQRQSKKNGAYWGLWFLLCVSNNKHVCYDKRAPTCVFVPGVIGLLKLFRSQM